MIIKSYEVKKINQNNNKIILLYGKNDGAKKEAINSLIINKKETFSYDQNEILENKNIFFDNIYSQSLFEEKKTIIIKRTNDKFTTIIESINLDKDPKSYTFETYSDDLNKILQLLGIEKFHIWSMAWGTRAALAYASLFPEKICASSLSLTSSKSKSISFDNS